MKKFGLILLALILCGCSSKEESKNVYKNGTYEMKAQGYGGEFVVKTTIKNDQISDIIVGENNETPSVGGVAIEQIISSMKKKNSYDVDVISGATITSQAMKGAVKDALTKAKN